jgi:hypothetical protein
MGSFPCCSVVQNPYHNNHNKNVPCSHMQDTRGGCASQDHRVSMRCWLILECGAKFLDMRQKRLRIDLAMLENMNARSQD